MGTRHLTCVIKDNKYKVAQYGQWDGYPEGTGAVILDFLRNKMDRKLFKEKLDNNVRWATKKELKQQWVDAGADPNDNMVSMDISDKHRKLYPENSRDTGAEILEIIQYTNKVLKLFNNIEFAGDSLFCE